ncbi:MULTISPECIES: hypothetical protein [Shewanella]|uniref:Lipoprotein n=1 Tax=Shewanella electrodiphila TaxID=934143 RepID=A0ABT0KJE8_9GAMM|nr:hypothetical protein [Shewanella goraebulensis]MCL1043965.1 hypothetical protein [Shewanella electrodiphila]
MKILKFVLLLSVIATMTGCATRLEATVAPGQSLTELGNVYVQHFSPDKRNLNYIIADKLTLLGYPATPLDGTEVPNDANIVITYVDNWQWDITNYLIKIKIDFRKAENKQLLITGESFRTSLARKDPDFMIQEALEKIFQEAGLKYNHIAEKQ